MLRFFFVFRVSRGVHKTVAPGVNLADFQDVAEERAVLVGVGMRPNGPRNDSSED